MAASGGGTAPHAMPPRGCHATGPQTSASTTKHRAARSSLAGTGGAAWYYRG
jgi:hypothetical protein